MQLVVIGTSVAAMVGAVLMNMFKRPEESLDVRLAVSHPEIDPVLYSSLSPHHCLSLSVR
jgi:hypothetical protein